jgi:ABC-type sugar transport system ATPase subunit
VLLVSAELDEVLELSDRVAVMYRGQIVAVVDGRTADRNEVGVLMATGMRQEAAIASGAIPAEEAAPGAVVAQVEGVATPTSQPATPAEGPTAPDGATSSSDGATAPDPDGTNP